MNRIDFDQAKRIPIGQVLEARGILASLHDKGERIVGACPVHGGDNLNAFVVSRSRNCWYCFTRCAAGGDVIDLVARLDRTDRIAAARALLHELPADDLPNHLRHRPEPTESTETTGYQDHPFRPFTRQLCLDHGAPLLQRKQIRVDTARQFEAGAWKGRGFLEQCVAVRLHDTDGNPLGYAGRRLEQEQAVLHGKWKVPPRLPKHRLLYAWHRCRARTQRGIIVVECPWGVMRLAQLGLPAVALLGTAMSEYQSRILRAVSPVILMLDADPAGTSAAQRISTHLKAHVDTHIIALHDGCDPDDLSDDRLRTLLQTFFP